MRFPLGPPASRLFLWLALSSLLAIPLSYAFAIACVAFVAIHFVMARPRGFIVVHGWGVTRIVRKREDTLARFTEPFGITLLASQATRRALLAITSPHRTRYVGVRLEGRVAGALLEHASIVADGDALSAHARDGDSMTAENALAFLRAVRAIVPLAQKRLFMSGSRGERIVLDGAELRVEALKPPQPTNQVFDLESPLEWRGFLFHESLGPAASIYQATWIRQGSAELVLVAPMPTELLLGPLKHEIEKSRHQTTKLDSLSARLLQPSPDEPPPPDLRTGIERLFMLPLREALARAPRPSRNVPKRHASSPDVGV